VTITADGLTFARAVAKTDGPGLAALFEACECRCFCRYWHFEGDKNDWLARCFGDLEANQRELLERVERGDDEALGVVAVAGDAIVGWLKVAPRASVAKAYDQRLYRGLPLLDPAREGVFFLGCALVLPAARKSGVATALVAAAVKLGRARGALLLEAFPRRPREAVRDEELWTIPVGALEANGFRPVAGEDPYPVLQRVIEPPRQQEGGVVLVDKPAGMTSHDVVSRMRRRLGTKRVGHAGTLDPMATGLLLVLFGDGTKLEPYLSTADKRYAATIAFGRSTDTLDKEGETVAAVAPSAALLQELADLEHSLAAPAPLLRAALAGELARRQQLPPAYSAIKVGGVRSYQLARKGAAPDLPSRPVHILALALTAASVAEASVTVELHVTKGYYVRSFSRDLGDALGCSSHLAALRRTAAGPYDVADSVALDASKETIAARATGIVEVASRVLPTVALAAEEERDIRNGKPIAFDEARASGRRTFALTNASGSVLVAIATAADGKLTVARGFG
jgi:tRNA pseudouridine55 synthase